MREDTLSRLSSWTHTYGAALCPPSGRADSYGEGMRDAKDQVAEILRNGKSDPLTLAAPDLLAALEGYHAWMTADLDEVAAEFYRETLRLAPFKDAPAAAPEVQASREEWQAWVDKRKAALLENARAALARAKGEG